MTRSRQASGLPGARRLALVLLVLLPIREARAQERPAPSRAIAVTFDDLPVGGPVPGPERERIFRRLVEALRRDTVPAIGFVNERQLYREGSLDSGEVNLLQTWRDAGLELGNHSYSHPDLHRNTLETFTRDVLRGEAVTRALLAEQGGQPQFFRHPFLHTGLSLPVRDSLTAFLADHGYRVAPVTHDNAEWIFALAYERAAQRRDAITAERVARAYMPYMERKLEYWERQSVSLFGREIPQVLLLHANRLNSEHLGDLIGMLRRRGYRLVTLGEALRDPAFDSPDQYAGRAGISWLHRWAISRGPGHLLPDEPMAPDFVLRAAGVDSE